MSDLTADTQPTGKKKKIPAILGAVLAVALGAGGFFITYTGMIGGDGSSAPAPRAASTPNPQAEVVFVQIDPITINLGTRGQSRHLRFNAQLEVAPANVAEVRRLMPRIVDVLNIYLRALDIHELEEPSALMRLRAQMLRRIQIVTGQDGVSDLLISEFVFN
mgnify:CR=1 FL=1